MKSEWDDLPPVDIRSIPTTPRRARVTWMLTEDEIRAKVIELLDYMSQARMDLWIETGVLTGVLDAGLVEKCLNEEIHTRSLEVKQFWYDPCKICGNLGAGSHSHAARN